MLLMVKSLRYHLDAPHFAMLHQLHQNKVTANHSSDAICCDKTFSCCCCSGCVHTQVVSRTAVTFLPPKSAPLSDTSLIAISAAGPILATIDSIGPVKPRNTPILTPWPSASAGEANDAAKAAAPRNFFIFFSPKNNSKLSNVKSF